MLFNLFPGDVVDDELGFLGLGQELRVFQSSLKGLTQRDQPLSGGPWRQRKRPLELVLFSPRVERGQIILSLNDLGKLGEVLDLRVISHQVILALFQEWLMQLLA